MKVALCFSGLPRFITQTYSYWKNCIIDKYDPDIFIHTWSNDKNIKMLLQGLYEPKVLGMESTKTFDVSVYNEKREVEWPYRTSHQTQISQYTGIQRSLQFCQEWEYSANFEYDIVVRARFDWFLKSVDFEINDCINVAHTPTLNGHKFVFQNQPYIGISDQFAYGNSKNMRVYSQLVDNLPFLYKEHKVDFCGELFLKAHLVYNNIDVKEHEWDNGIVRDWGIMP